MFELFAPPNSKSAAPRGKLRLLAIAFYFLAMFGNSSYAGEEEDVEESIFHSMAGDFFSSESDDAGGFIVDSAVSLIFGSNESPTDPNDTKELNDLNKLSAQMTQISSDISQLTSTVKQLETSLKTDTDREIVATYSAAVQTSIDNITTQYSQLQGYVSSAITNEYGANAPEQAKKIACSILSSTLANDIGNIHGFLIGSGPDIAGSGTGLINNWADLIILQQADKGSDTQVATLTQLFYQALFWEFQGFTMLRGANQFVQQKPTTCSSPYTVPKTLSADFYTDKIQPQVNKYLDNVDRLVLNEFQTMMHTGTATDGTLVFPTSHAQAAFAQADFFASIALGQSPGIRVRQLFRPSESAQTTQPYNPGSGSAIAGVCPSPPTEYQAWWKLVDATGSFNAIMRYQDSDITICRYANPNLVSFNNNLNPSVIVEGWDISTFAKSTAQTKNPIQYAYFTDSSRLVVDPLPNPKWTQKQSIPTATSGAEIFDGDLYNEPGRGANQVYTPIAPSSTDYSLKTFTDYGPTQTTPFSGTYSFTLYYHFVYPIPWSCALDVPKAECPSTPPPALQYIAGLTFDRSWETSGENPYPNSSAGGLDALEAIFPPKSFPAALSGAPLAQAGNKSYGAITGMANAPKPEIINLIGFTFGGKFDSTFSSQTNASNILTTNMNVTVNWLRLAWPMPMVE